MKTVFRLADHVTRVPINGEGIIVDTQQRVFYRVNDTADWILAQLECGARSLENLAKELISKFPTEDPVQLSSSVAAFIQQLQKLNLIAEEKAEEEYSYSSRGIPELKRWTGPLVQMEGEVQTVVAQLTARLAAREAALDSTTLSLVDQRAPLALPKSSPLTQFPRSVDIGPIE